MILKIVKPEYIALVGLFKMKGTEKYRFVNITKEHICSCEFDSIEEAISDLEDQIVLGKVIKYSKIDITYEE